MITPSSAASATHLIDLARRRAAEAPETAAFHFLGGTGEQSDSSYGWLDRRARAIAARLRRRGCARKPVLVLHPEGPEWVAAFFGCQYAGAIAVPVPPPTGLQARAALPRLRGIAADCEAAAILTTSGLRAKLGNEEPALARMPWEAVEEVPDDEASCWEAPDVAADDLALLQYTSGSTGDPRGVMLTHANILANCAVITARMGMGPSSRGVSWLPPFHDMGLIGGIIQPMYAGCSCALLTPATFMRHPMRWLEAISGRRGVVSGGPNFAYEHCVHRTTAQERSRLDLSGWEVAFVGAEPLRAATLRRFAEAFAIAGFRPEALFPCYGLAESSLMVSGGRSGPPRIVWVGRDRLASDEVVPVPAGDPSGLPLVGCGPVGPGHVALIVDPKSRRPSAPGQVGEIWVSGPSVGLGYWGRPELSEDTFRARAVGVPATYLRSGDLGFLHGGELVIAGRLKDVMILDGRKLHPTDLEQTAAACYPALRSTGGAAFTVEEDGEERLVLVQEVERRAGVDLRALAGAIRAQLSEVHGVSARVVLVKAGAVPRTSSGKVRRGACRAAYLAGTLPVADEVAPAAPPAPRAGDEVCRWLLAAVARLKNVPAADLDPEAPIDAYGISSRELLSLLGQLEEWLGREVPVAVIRPRLSVAGLARLLAGGEPMSPAAVPSPVGPARAEAALLDEIEGLSEEEARRRLGLARFP